jgi:uncharacterized membrane protein (UPF0127 family)
MIFGDFMRRAVLTFLLFCVASVFAWAESPITFSKGKIKVGNKVVHVEFADTPERRAQGLMFRKSLKQDHGMLFTFDYEHHLSFWMANTLIPLSIGFFDKNNRLLHSVEMKPAVLGEVQPRHYVSRQPALYALEMPAGWFTKHDIKPGAILTIIHKP